MFDLLAQLDWSLVYGVLFGISFGKQDSAQQQQAESYGPLGSGTIRGQGQNALADLLFGRGRTGAGGVSDMLLQRTQAPVEYTPPNLLGATQGGVRTAFEEAVRQGLGRFSADYARRGFNRPENVEAIVGSTVQNVAPQFANLYAGAAAQQEQARAQAPLVREDVLRQRFTDLLNALGINISALGGQSTSFGRGESSGFNAGVLQNLQSIKT